MATSRRDVAIYVALDVGEILNANTSPGVALKTWKLLKKAGQKTRPLYFLIPAHLSKLSNLGKQPAQQIKPVIYLLYYTNLFSHSYLFSFTHISLLQSSLSWLISIRSYLSMLFSLRPSQLRGKHILCFTLWV